MGNKPITHNISCSSLMFIFPSSPTIDEYNAHYAPSRLKMAVSESTECLR